jgi:hypothetical protein
MGEALRCQRQDTLLRRLPFPRQPLRLGDLRGVVKESSRNVALRAVPTT